MSAVVLGNGRIGRNRRTQQNAWRLSVDGPVTPFIMTDWQCIIVKRLQPQNAHLLNPCGTRRSSSEV